MPKNDTSTIGIYVLLVLAIGLMIYVYYRNKEGFEEKPEVVPVPDSCEKYGWGFSKGVVQIFSQLDQPLPQDFQRRQYTPSDCRALGGKFVNGDCKVTEGDATFSYGMKCRGLNAQSTPVPVECGINSTYPGKPLKGFTITYQGTPITVLDNTVRIYNKDECVSELSGNFINLATVKDMTKKSLNELVAENVDKNGNPIFDIKEINAALAANGSEYGVCLSQDMNILYSGACTNAPAGVLGSVSGAAGSVTSLFG
jgi:hypothetical protein